jgi:hypothetical protein
LNQSNKTPKKREITKMDKAWKKNNNALSRWAEFAEAAAAAGGGSGGGLRGLRLPPGGPPPHPRIYQLKQLSEHFVFVRPLVSRMDPDDDAQE